MDPTLSEAQPDPMYQPDSPGKTVSYYVYSWLQPILFALTVLILVSTFLGRLIGVDGDSMLPTLHNGDMLVLQSVGYTPKNGDVVVLSTPTFRGGAPLVKRIIATGGQRLDIDYDAGVVYVDGVALEEDYLGETMRKPSFDHYDYPLTVPEGCVFVMGDNRNNSSDSRYDEFAQSIGMVDQRRVLGRAVWILFPFSRFGGVPG